MRPFCTGILLLLSLLAIFCFLASPIFLMVSSVEAQTRVQGPRVYEGSGNFCDNTSPTDSYACTYSNPLQAYVHGTCYSMFTTVANTGAATVDLGPGVKPLVNGEGSDLVTGDIKANSQFHFCYNQPNDNMRLMIGVSGGGASPPFITLLNVLSAGSVTILGSVHGQGSNIEVTVQYEPAVDRWAKAMVPARVDKSNANVTVTFSSAFTGRLLISQMAGATQGPSIPSDHAGLQNLSYDQSNHTGFARLLHAAQHKYDGSDPVADGEPTIGGIPRAFSGSELHPNWLPIFSLLYRGAVPPPGSGGETKFLRGDGTWQVVEGGGEGGGVTGLGPEGGPYRTGNVWIQAGDVAAAIVGFTATSTLSSTNVYDALIELLNETIPLSSKGQPSGVASLDSSTKIPVAQLPLALPDQGSGGTAGALPAPAPGDADNCLKGSMTYGPCGSGGSGSGITAYLPNGNLLQANVSNVRFLGSGVVSSTYDTINSRWDVNIASSGSSGGACDVGDGYICQTGSTVLSGNIDMNIGTSYFSVSVPNSTSAATTLYRLVTLTSSGNPAMATTAGNSDPMVLGICQGNCTNSGLAKIAIKGTALCEFVSAPTQRQWVVSGAAGKCVGQDAKPSSGAIGLVLDADNVGGKYKVYLF